MSDEREPAGSRGRAGPPSAGCWPRRSVWPRPARVRRRRPASRARPAHPRRPGAHPGRGAPRRRRSCSCCPAPRSGARGAVGGAVLGVLTILKVFDMGFLSVLGRPFDPVLDWALLGNAREFLAGLLRPGRRDRRHRRRRRCSPSSWSSLMALAVLRLSRVVGRHRRAATRAVAVLSVAWVACARARRPARRAGAGGLPQRGRAGVREGAAGPREPARRARVRRAGAPIDGFRAAPRRRAAERAARQGRRADLHRELRAQRRRGPALRPADRSPARRRDGAARRRRVRRAQRLADLAAGRRRQLDGPRHVRVRPAVDNQQRYRSLVVQRPPDAEPRRSSDAGWETTDVMPGTNRAWPEGAFFGFDRVHDAPHARLPRPELRLVADARPVHAVGRSSASSTGGRTAAR